MNTFIQKLHEIDINNRILPRCWLGYGTAIGPGAVIYQYWLSVGRSRTLEIRADGRSRLRFAAGWHRSEIIPDSAVFTSEDRH